MEPDFSPTSNLPTIHFSTNCCNKNYGFESVEFFVSRKTMLQCREYSHLLQMGLTSGLAVLHPTKQENILIQ